MRTPRGQQGVAKHCWEQTNHGHCTATFEFAQDVRFSPIPSLAELLKRAGFHVRHRRADCTHCEGSSRLTVSFTDEVAFCHRCKWSGNIRTLSRDLGLPLAPIPREILARREREAEFNEWLNTCLTIIANLWRELTLQAELAKQILAFWPDEELAWDVLADFYHSQADFEGAIEFLSFQKLPCYLDQPMTREQLFHLFEEADVA
jgi:hypothetical protein